MIYLKKEISKILFPHSIWRYVSLFQSLEQFASWLAITTISFIAFRNLFSLDISHSVPPSWLLIGIIVGSIFSLILALPAKLIIETSRLSDFDLLRGSLAAMRYIEIDKNNEIYTFRPNLPWILRWKEQNVYVQRCPERIEICSGFWVVRLLRKTALNYPSP